MKTLTKNISKTLSTVVLATSLLMAVSVQASEKQDIEALTAFMVEQTTQQVNQQLSAELNNDIALSVMMKLPVKEDKTGNVKQLLAKNMAKNKTNEAIRKVIGE
jgi:hypothetical protein